MKTECSFPSATLFIFICPNSMHSYGFILCVQTSVISMEKAVETVDLLILQVLTVLVSFFSKKVFYLTTEAAFTITAT